MGLLALGDPDRSALVTIALKLGPGSLIKAEPGSTKQAFVLFLSSRVQSPAVSWARYQL